MYKNLFIQFPVDRHLGGFRFEDIANKVAKKDCQFSYGHLILFLLGLNVEWLSNMVGICFEETEKQFSKVFIPY
jgi:hypothetical protein